MRMINKISNIILLAGLAMIFVCINYAIVTDHDVPTIEAKIVLSAVATLLIGIALWIIKEFGNT